MAHAIAASCRATILDTPHRLLLICCVKGGECTHGKTKLLRLQLVGSNLEPMQHLGMVGNTSLESLLSALMRVESRIQHALLALNRWCGAKPMQKLVHPLI